MMDVDYLTVLTCADKNKTATKTFTKCDDGRIEKKSFGMETYFECDNVHISSVKDLYRELLTLSEEKNKLVIRGGLKGELPEDMLQSGTNNVRRKKDVFSDTPRYWVMLDIDEFEIPSFLCPKSDPEQVVNWVVLMLPDVFHGVSFVYKFSSSQSVYSGANTVSLHLWFWCDQAVSGDEWKRLFKYAWHHKIDTAVFNTVQPHYTASPIFNGMDDPLRCRIGLIEKNQDALKIPDIPALPKRQSAKRKAIHTVISSEIYEQAMQLLSAVYPKEGNRHRFSASVVGTLYRLGLPEDWIAEFIFDLAIASGDDEADAREHQAYSICEAIDNGDPAQGIPTLVDDFGFNEIDDLKALFVFDEEDIDDLIESLNKKSSTQEIRDVLDKIKELDDLEKDERVERVVELTGRGKRVLSKELNKQSNSTRHHSDDTSTKLARLLLDTYYKGGEWLIRTMGDFYIYNGTHYEKPEPEYLKQQLQSLIPKLKEDSPNHATLIKNTLEILESLTFVEGDPLRFKSKKPTALNTKNCEIWFDESTGGYEYRPHNSKSFFTSCLDVEFDPNAKAPEFLKAYDEIFKKNKQPEELKRHLFEYMAYVIFPVRSIPTVMLFRGEGNDGKTSSVKIIMNFLGQDRVISGRVDQLERNAFKLGELAGKYLYVDDDVSKGAVLPDGTLKKISEEKYITGDRKNKNDIGFLNTATPLLLANNYPVIRDLSSGMQRRLYIIPFLRQFTAAEDDKGLFDRIWNKEASGILNIILESFAALYERQRFDVPAECEAAQKKWLLKGNDIMYFVHKQLEKTEGRGSTLSDVLDDFRGFCFDESIRCRFSRKEFANELSAMGITVREGEAGTQYLYGMKLKSEDSGQFQKLNTNQNFLHILGQSKLMAMMSENSENLVH